MASRSRASRSPRTARASDRQGHTASRAERAGFAEAASTGASEPTHAHDARRTPSQAAARSTAPASDTDTAARAQAQQFGALVRERREALHMRQDDLALATGVGRRFILELEAGKPTCQLGRALIVAAAVGLRPFDLMSANSDDDNALLPDLDEDAADDLPALEDDDRG